MRNCHVLLLGVLGLLVAREGVEGVQCYSCSNCASLDASEATRTCSSSCLATVTCQGDDNHFVNRLCSVTNKATGCVASASSADTHECYCNTNSCDALAGTSDLCSPAGTTAASLALLLAALLPTFLLG